jgi:hypothetical protein
VLTRLVGAGGVWTARGGLADLTRPVGIRRVRSGLSKTAVLTRLNLGPRRRAGLSRSGGLAGSGTRLLISTADARLRRCVEPGAGLNRSARRGRGTRSVVPGRR